jgi:hypothetical protein
MRLHRLLVTVLAIATTALLVPAVSSAAVADGVLSMTAARKETRSVAWEVARRNHLVSSVKVGACQRQASDQVLCEAIDRGSSSTFRTTCEVRVRVTLVGTRPKGTLRAVNCDNERLLVLRVPEALAAARPVAEGLRNGEFALSAERRISRTEIAVMAAWPAKDEICGAHLNVELTEAEEIAVRVTEFFCTVPKS